ncbi:MULTISPECIES: amino acid ABC transporter permease [unclassified Mesorhizobium]|uniref:amino acid ABC transporter permease n=1 Tax=unclassified Mesorhizobium TaxID=325217 RepID=UPI000FDB3D71|nr:MULTISPECIES: amino acid ABC transporter permease [unclassified Mesorhizobium]TGQ46929.1 amino acid ABC transporter permease [Mesorhizobium sp. M00.F.Ca.ET.216.01.1.1]TIS91879.1 MAG: ABC transporter permease subunit [Mesorhizobium sp.]TJW41681.1 MAG: ABC transporter permease subunit [Mesorhizobium sp.]
MTDATAAYVAGVARLPDDALRDVKRAHQPFPLVRVALWTLAFAVAAGFAYIVAVNPNFGWPVVAQYFFDPTVMQGLSVTLGLTVVAMILGIVLGLLLAISRMSKDRLASSLSGLFIWFFRGTPLLVQLIFWYNLSTLFPRISLGFASWETNDLITPLTAAILGLALNEAAYMAEIIRGGLLSVDKGQAETAEAFGMTRARALWRIIIPQAMKSIVPPTGNQLISMIKATSLVSVIAMADLLYSVQSIYNRTFEIIPLLMVAVLWYLLITSILNVGQGAIERYYSRGDRGAQNSAPEKLAATRAETADERA